MDQKNKLVVVVGPTGSGKSALAVNIAEEIDAEIVNADSMQVYRDMDIGTAKPSADEQARVPHHLLDIVSPDINFTAADFCREATAAIDDIIRRGKRAVVVGGTGLYIRALLNGLVDTPCCNQSFREQLGDVSGEELLYRLSLVDPESAGRLHANDRIRIIRALEVFHETGQPVSQVRTEHAFSAERYCALKIGIKMDRQELYRRIDLRVESMLQAGLVEEIRALLQSGYGADLKSMRSIGYKEIVAFLAGAYPLDEAIRLIKRDTRHYAKRQMTWFNRDGEIYWLEYPGSFATILGHVIEFFA